MSTLAPARLERRPLVAALLAEVPEALIVTGLGSPSYDVYAAAPERQGIFYLWGAMGGAVPTGLGLALSQPDKQVLVVTGDGEQLMGVGSLATVAASAPKNLNILVLDNGHFGETGMQQSHTSLGTDLAAVARGFGLETVLSITEYEELLDFARHVKAGNGPVFAQAFIEAGEQPRALPSRDGVAVKNAFRAHLGLGTL
jgi:thiamine pyrophosphate-dependent acetolactate synthase large subunit-like protein